MSKKVKKSFAVSIPIAGSVTFEVEAEDEESAVAAAWEKVDEGEEGDVTWEYFDKLVEGNCLHPSQNEVEVSGGD